MTGSIYTLQQFVEDARAIIDRRLGEARTLEALSEPLQRVIQRQDCLADAEPEGNPDPDRGFPIYRAEDLSILAVVWQPGSGTPVHNHNGWAIEGIISGTERNRNYARLDDGSQPWVAKLEEVSPSIVGTGETTCLALPPNDIHAVEIPAGKTLAIHVYGNDLYKQWRYQFDLDTGEVKPFRSGMRREPNPPAAKQA
jgi:predicted metal-dependent enzyme (double-stranded beta helix superfamily)